GTGGSDQGDAHGQTTRSDLYTAVDIEWTKWIGQIERGHGRLAATLAKWCISRQSGVEISGHGTRTTSRRVPGAGPGPSPASTQPQKPSGGSGRRFLTRPAPIGNADDDKARPEARPAGRPV